MNPKDKIAEILVRCGISANALTFCGLMLAAVSGILAYRGEFFLAGTVLLASGALDMLDGAVARRSGSAKVPFGGILDSTLDRYGDGFVLAGVFLYCAQTHRPLYALLGVSALLGSFSISYVRARAECEVDSCRVGYWERGERLVFLAIALLLGNLAPALWVLGLMTHATVIYRLMAANDQRYVSIGRGASAAPVLIAFFLDTRRGTAPYLIKTASFLSILFFYRPAF